MAEITANVGSVHEKSGHFEDDDNIGRKINVRFAFGQVFQKEICIVIERYLQDKFIHDNGRLVESFCFACIVAQCNTK